MGALFLIIRFVLYACAGKLGMVDGFDVDLQEGVLVIHLEAAARMVAGIALTAGTWLSSRVAARFGLLH